MNIFLSLNVFLFSFIELFFLFWPILASVAIGIEISCAVVSQFIENKIYDMVSGEFFPRNNEVKRGRKNRFKNELPEAIYWEFKGFH